MILLAQPVFPSDSGSSSGGAVRHNRLRSICVVLAVGATYFGLARLGLLTVSQGTHVAPLWPAGGFLLGVLLLSERRRWPWLLLAATAAGMAAQLAVGRATPVAVGLSAANCAESLLAALGWRRLASGRLRLDALHSVLVFAFAGVTAAGVTALLGAGVLALGMGSPYWSTWVLLWLADGVGILVITPVVLVTVEVARGAVRPSLRRVVEEALVLAGLAAVALGIFTRPVGGSRLVLDFVFPVFPFLLICAGRSLSSLPRGFEVVEVGRVRAGAQAYLGPRPGVGSPAGDMMVDGVLFPLGEALRPLGLWRPSTRTWRQQHAGSRPRCIGDIQALRAREVSRRRERLVSEFSKCVVAAFEQLASKRQARAVTAEPLGGLPVVVAVRRPWTPGGLGGLV